MKIILIMGLPGSGKTTLANELAPMLNAKRLNADEVRKEANDWDFSEEGRKRQAKRMADFALKMKKMEVMLLQILFVQHLKQEVYFQLIILFGLIPLKKVDLMIPIKCLLNQISITFMLLLKMLKTGHLKY